MKKHYYKLIAGLVAGMTLFSLTGCGGENNEEQGIGAETESAQTIDKKGETNKIPRGRYVEKSLDVPEVLDFISMYTTDDEGNVYVYGYTENQLEGYHKQGEGEWDSLETTALEKLLNENYQLQLMEIGPENSLYVLCDDPQYNPIIAKINQDQSIEYIPIKHEEETLYPDHLEVLENGDFMIGSYGLGATRYNGQDGTSMMTYYSQDGIFTTQEDTLAILDSQRGGVVFYNIQTGKEINFAKYEYLENGTRIVMDDKKSTYIVNSKGISRLAEGGSAWENIIEESMSSFGMPSLYIMNVKVVGESFHVLFGNYSGESEIMVYTYDADAPTQPTTELSVYMLEENAVLRQAVAEYQRQNQDVVIQVQVGMTSTDGVTKSDAIRTLNTQLLAGKGPDILVLDGLPIDSYKEKGVLLNIEDDIAPIIEKEEVFTNVLEAYREDDGIYAIPTRFTLPLLFGSEMLLEEYTDLIGISEWAIANPQDKVFYPIQPEILLTQFFGASAPLWIDETGQIQAEGFGTFLEAIKSLSDVEAEVYEEPFIQELWSREYMAYKDTQLYMTNLVDFSGIEVGYSGLEHRNEGVFKSITVDGQGVFEPMGVVGINANTQYEEIAREIVKLSLSEDVQRAIPGQGFPVNHKAFNERAIHDDNIMFGTPAQAILGPASRPIDSVMLNQGVYDAIKSIANNVTVPIYQDEVLLQIIIEETKGYFDGTKTIDETVEAVTKRTKAYLAE